MSPGHVAVGCCFECRLSGQPGLQVMDRAEGSGAPSNKVDAELVLSCARSLQRLCRLPEGQRAVQATACSPWGVGWQDKLPLDRLTGAMRKALAH